MRKRATLQRLLVELFLPLALERNKEGVRFPNSDYVLTNSHLDYWKSILSHNPNLKTRNHLTRGLVSMGIQEDDQQHKTITEAFDALMTPDGMVAPNQLKVWRETFGDAAATMARRHLKRSYFNMHKLLFTGYIRRSLDQPELLGRLNKLIREEIKEDHLRLWETVLAKAPEIRTRAHLLSALRREGYSEDHPHSKAIIKLYDAFLSPGGSIHPKNEPNWLRVFGSLPPKKEHKKRQRRH